MAIYAPIDKFRSHVKQVGLPTASHFNVILPAVPGSNAGTISMLCESTAIPGVSLMSSELKLVGEFTDMPYMAAYAPINLTFIEDNNFAVKRYFQNWFNSIWDKTTRTIGYYSSYAQRIDIMVSDRSGKIRFCVRLNEAYPKSISDQGLSYSNHEVIRTEVQIVYKYWQHLEVTANGEVIEPVLQSKMTTSISEGSRSSGGILPGSLGNLTGFGKLANLSGFNFGTDVGSELSKWGPAMGAEFTRGGSGVNALFNASSMTNGSSIGNSFLDLGNSMGSFGQTIGEVGKSLGSIGAVAGTLSSAIGGVSGTLSSVDTVLKTVGINSGLGKIGADMSQIAGKVGVISQVAGLPGQLGAVGANMGAVQGQIQSVVKSMESLPGVTNQMKTTLSSFGNIFGNKGSEMSNAASAIESGVQEGRL